MIYHKHGHGYRHENRRNRYPELSAVKAESGNGAEMGTSYFERYGSISNGILFDFRFVKNDCLSRSLFGHGLFGLSYKTVVVLRSPLAEPMSSSRPTSRD